MREKITCEITFPTLYIVIALYNYFFVQFFSLITFSVQKHTKFEEYIGSITKTQDD